MKQRGQGKKGLEVGEGSQNQRRPLRKIRDDHIMKAMYGLVVNPGGRWVVKGADPGD